MSWAHHTILHITYYHIDSSCMIWMSFLTEIQWVKVRDFQYLTFSLGAEFLYWIDQAAMQARQGLSIWVCSAHFIDHIWYIKYKFIISRFWDRRITSSNSCRKSHFARKGGTVTSAAASLINDNKPVWFFFYFNTALSGKCPFSQTVWVYNSCISKTTDDKLILYISYMIYEVSTIHSYAQPLHCPHNELSNSIKNFSD